LPSHQHISDPLSQTQAISENSVSEEYTLPPPNQNRQIFTPTPDPSTSDSHTQSITDPSSSASQAFDIVPTQIMSENENEIVPTQIMSCNIIPTQIIPSSPEIVPTQIIASQNELVPTQIIDSAPEIIPTQIINDGFVARDPVETQTLDDNEFFQSEPPRKPNQLPYVGLAMPRKNKKHIPGFDTFVGNDEFPQVLPERQTADEIPSRTVLPSRKRKQLPYVGNVMPRKSNKPLIPEYHPFLRGYERLPEPRALVTSNESESREIRSSTPQFEMDVDEEEAEEEEGEEAEEEDLTRSISQLSFSSLSSAASSSGELFYTPDIDGY
jgi:hypothetical protein